MPTPVILEPSLRGRERETTAAFLPAPLLLLADTTTFAVAGKRWLDALGSGASLHLLDAPHPQETLAREIAAFAANHASILAIGSGTINDLAKYAAFLAGIPYAVVATAPSMNGYVSANASMVVDGHRTSLAARPPVAVFAELETLAAAPARLIRSGLGDSLCRSTAQADWLLSHHLLGTPYDPRPFAMLKPYEEALFERADRLCAGDMEAIRLLFSTLIASGEGMNLAGGSYPASQGEHMIAHTLAMMGHAPGYHGEQIGVTTLTMAARQEALLEATEIRLFSEEPSQAFHDSFHPALASSLLENWRIKLSRITAYSFSPANRWEVAVDAIRPVIQPTKELRTVLERINAPIDPQTIGWGDAEYRTATEFARWTRDRFTFLDLEG